MTGLDPDSPTCRSQLSREGQMKTRAAVAYLLLSAISGFTELGSIALAIRTNCSLAQLLTFGLAYQAGGLLSNPLRFCARHYQGFLLLASVAGFLFHAHSTAGPLAVFLLSVGLQGMRERVAGPSGVSTLAKRASRIAGFVAIGAFGGVSLSIVPLAVIAISMFWGGFGTDDVRSHFGSPIGRVGAANLIMVIHQMHYFCYSYLVPLVLMSTLHVSPIAAGMGFAVGWISYSLAPMALQRFGTVRTIVVGHMGVAMCLIAMASLTHNLLLFLGAWFASGFGGGTVFGIRRLGRMWPWDGVGNLDFWEQIGHVLGVLLAAVIALRIESQPVFFILAASLAATVAVGVTLAHIMHDGNTDQTQPTI